MVNLDASDSPARFLGTGPAGEVTGLAAFTSRP